MVIVVDAFTVFLNFFVLLILQAEIIKENTGLRCFGCHILK